MADGGKAAEGAAAPLSSLELAGEKRRTPPISPYAPSSPVIKAAEGAAAPLSSLELAGEKMTDADILRRLLGYLWPPGKWQEGE